MPYPNTGIPSPILLAICAIFAVWYVVATWYEHRRKG